MLHWPSCISDLLFIKLDASTNKKYKKGPGTVLDPDYFHFHFFV